MALKDITHEAVLSAVAEFKTLGETEFYATYGFAPARHYWLLVDGHRYPSKAIAGVAHRYIDGEQLMGSASFTGGNASVAKKLRQLGFEVESPGRNPDWTRDELILALDLYFSDPKGPPGKSSAPVAALSELLNTMHNLIGGEGAATFRNADGVYLKLMNLRSLDPKFTAQGKVGMKSGGTTEKALWSYYLGRRDDLKADAKAIRDAVSALSLPAVQQLPPVPPYEGEEGGVIIGWHKRYERDPKLIAEKRKEAKAKGMLVCEVCAFDFAKVYGSLGENFIEVHHTKPVAKMKPGSKSRLADLALLCSNCHRMAHRKREPLSIDQIRAAFSGQVL